MDPAQTTKKSNYKQVIEEIKQNTPIESLMEGVTLTPLRGKYKYKCCCPIHSEKTPSFYIYDDNSFRCFGCKESGDVISFFEKKENLSTGEAIARLAKLNNLELNGYDLSEEQRKELALRKEIFDLNDFILRFYLDELLRSPKALEYAKERIPKNQITDFSIGFAPGGYNTLYKYLKKQGYDDELIFATQIFTQKENKTYDLLQNRLVFPIKNNTGNTIGFLGRSIDNNEPKYLYCRNNDLTGYHKKKLLYGIDIARKHIKDKEKVIIVEGPTDITRLNSIDVKNSVAIGTNTLSEEQIFELAKLTKTIVIIPDIDTNKAGQKGVKSSVELLAEHDFNVFIYDGIPEGEDPDSFFASEPDKYQESKEILFAVWETLNLFRKLGENPDPITTTKATKESAKYISMLPGETLRENVLRDLRNTFRKNKWPVSHIDNLKHEVKTLTQQNPNNSDNNKGLPGYVDFAFLSKYKFWQTIDDPQFNKDWPPNQYIKGEDPVTEFILHPLGQIMDTDNEEGNFRFFRAVNVFKESRLVKLSDEDWSSARSFRKKMSRAGRFICKPGFDDKTLETLKQYWITESYSFYKIKKLGWQTQGFWAWSNGITTPEKQFIPVDENGFVDFKGTKYFIEYESKIHLSEHGNRNYINERKFKYIDSNVKMKKWFEDFSSLYGDQARLSLCFYLTSVFQDHIFSITQSLPILNIHGSYGTGKSLKAGFLLSLFGQPQEPASLADTTKVRLSYHVANFKNSICAIDEYKNHYAKNFIEQLKGLYMRIGRKRMLDKDTAENLPVNSMAILMGQEIPNIDPALTSRLIYLSYKKRELTEDDREMFSRLKMATNEGFSNITAELIKYRPTIEKEFSRELKECMSKLKKDLGTDYSNIDTRLFENYSLVITTYKILKEAGLDIDLTIEQVSKTAIERIKEHNKILTTSNEVFDFFSEFEMLAHAINSPHRITSKYDYDLEFKENEEKQFQIKFSLNSIYKKIMASKGWGDKENMIDKGSLFQYLKNSRGFITYKESIRLGDRVTSGFIFDYPAISKEFKINLHDGIYNLADDVMEKIQADKKGTFPKPEEEDNSQINNKDTPDSDENLPF